MNTQIVVLIKNVYGEELSYPVNEQARLLAQIAGTKTLTPATLQRAHAMGFEIRQQYPMRVTTY